MIQPRDLIELFQKAYTERWGYIWGTAGETWTAVKQADAEKKYHQAEADEDQKGIDRWKTTWKYGRKWIGRRVSDCSGLFAWAFKQLRGYMPHGSNSMFKGYTSANGKLVSGRKESGEALTPGTAVFKYNDKDGYYHVGLCIDGTKVIEAQGTQEGVVISDVKKWHYWGELKGVDYKGEVKPVDYEKAVVIADGGVNFRAAKSTSATKIGVIPKGAEIEAADAGDGWSQVKYNGRTGFCMSKFIKYGDGGDDSDAIAIINNVIKELEKLKGLLKEMLEP